MQERRSVSHRIVFVALAVSLAAAFFVALFIHERFVKYQPKAAFHLPKQVAAAWRLDAEPTLGFAAFERHLLPLVELARRGPEPRAKHLERKTTIELSVDCREIVFAELEDGGWLVLAAGLFRHDQDVTSGVLRLAQEEGVDAELVGELVVFEAGPAFSVAEDGTLILASRSELAQQARGASAPFPLLSLMNKPATLFSFVRYPQAASWRRFWTFFEPGAPLPAYLELTLTGSGAHPKWAELAATELGISVLGPLRPEAAPPGVLAAASTLNQEQFDAAVAHSVRRVSEHLSRSFSGP